MNRLCTRPGAARAGFTLLETVISAAVLVVMARFTIEALQGLHGTTTSGTTNTRISISGEEALLSIIADLNASGFTTQNGKAYPYTFDEGDPPDPAFANHVHAAATHHAVTGDPDAGASREIVFLRPADADGDEVPDTNAGVLQWAAAEISYVLVTDASGVNVLERRTDAGSPQPIAYNVERVAFDDPTSLAAIGESLPSDSVRVRIYFRAVDDEGAVQRYLAEAVVRLRNG